MIHPSSFILHPSLIASTIGAGFETKYWWMIGVWIALLGAFFGSFMNVVIYRLPAGKRLAHPGSTCPFCGHGVRWFDNIPVLSWLALRGRCRDCKRSIAGRYPFVEALVGAMFLWLVLAEVHSNGTTLPHLHNTRQPGAEESALWIGYAYRLLMMCTLLCAVLIEYDGRCPPLKLYWPALLVGLCLPLWMPTVRPVAAWVRVPDPSQYTAVASASMSGSVADGLYGVCIGFLVGLFVAIGSRNLNAALALPLNFAILGVFLGWQSTILLAASVAGVCLVKDLLASSWAICRRLPDSAILLALTFLYILNWSRLAKTIGFLVSPEPLAMASVLAFTAAIGMLRAFLRSRVSRS